MTDEADAIAINFTDKRQGRDAARFAAMMREGRWDDFNRELSAMNDRIGRRVGKTTEGA